MPHFDVHLYREMRLLFEGIEAGSHEEAAALARARRTAEANEIADCEGETLAALVDVVGDEQHEQSRLIDFEAERQRQAAPKLLGALRYALEFLEANDDGEQDVQDRIASARAAIATAVDVAGNEPDKESRHGASEAERLRQAAPKLLEALTACELQLREYVHWHHANAGGCSVEIEDAWEQARDALAAARAG